MSIIKQAKDILEGHVKEVTGKNNQLSEQRLEICEQCSIFKMTSLGPICDSKKWIDPKTFESSNFPKSGYKKGCGCRLNAKTRLKSNHCIVGKW